MKDNEKLNTNDLDKVSGGDGADGVHLFFNVSRKIGIQLIILLQFQKRLDIEIVVF